MKKVLIGFLILIVLIIGTLIAIPVFFKEDVRKALDSQLEANLNATVVYDFDSFGLSLISSFPDLTISIGDFGIVGKSPFESDTLLFVGQFELSVDIMSVISGEKIVVTNVLLTDAIIRVLTLSDGTANYDIMKPSVDESSEVPDGEPSDPFELAVDQWQLVNADIIYYDLTIPFYTVMFGVEHTGSGNIREDVFDMTTQTTIRDFSAGYDGEEYVTAKTLSADIVMKMDLENWIFTFKENYFLLNDFGMSFDGSITMPAADIDMDLTFAGVDIDLKSVLSLTPGAYEAYLEGITAGGNVDFKGFVKGTYNDELMPHVFADFAINNGSISYADYPIPMDQIQMKASFDYPSADMRETKFDMSQFHMKLDGEEVNASLLFQDFEDYFWDFKLTGNLDLGKITRIFPIEGMELAGRINADMQTKGRMSDLDAEQYQKLTTSGKMSLRDFSFSDSTLGQPFQISRSELVFTPQQIVLSDFEGKLGRSDMRMSGELSNYLEYILSDESITGNLNFESNLLDLNEWMSEDEGSVAETDTISEELEVVRIPTNINFNLDAQVASLIYEDMELKDFKGSVIVKDGAIQLSNVGFDVLEGSFVMNGAYESTPEIPTYSFDMKITDFSIQSSYQTFATVKQLAPFTEKMTGKFSTNFKIAGDLGSDMMPVYETMSGGGLVNVREAGLNDVKLLSTVKELSGMGKKSDNPGRLDLRDVRIKVSIENGTVFVDPFDVRLAGYTSTIAGSNTVMGELNYFMTVKQVPTGAGGQAINSLAAQFLGTKELVSPEVDVNLGIKGTFTEPTVKLLGIVAAGKGEAVAGQSMQKALADQAKEEAKKQKEALEAEAKKATDEAKKEIEATVNEELDKASQDAAEKAKAALDDLLGKKKKKKNDGG